MRRLCPILKLSLALLLALLVLSCKADPLPDTDDLDEAVGTEEKSVESTVYEGGLGTLTITYTVYKDGTTSTAYSLEGYEVTLQDGVYTAGIYTLTLGDGAYSASCAYTLEGVLGTLYVTLTLEEDGSESYTASLDGYTVEAESADSFKAVSDEDSSYVYSLEPDGESYTAAAASASLTLTVSLKKFLLDDSGSLVTEDAEADDYLSFSFFFDDEEEALEDFSFSASLSFLDSFSPQTHSLTFSIYDNDGDEMRLYDESGNAITGFTLEDVSAGEELEIEAELCFFPSLYLEFTAKSSDLSSLFPTLDEWSGFTFTIYKGSGDSWEESDEEIGSLSASSGDSIRIKLAESAVFPVPVFGDTVTSVEALPKLGAEPGSALESFSDYSPFSESTTLESVADDIFINNTQLTDISYAFSGCSALTSLPSLSCLSQVTDISYAFSGCSSLAKLDDGLLSSNTALTTMKGTFKDCTALVYIPEDLFSENMLVTDFSEVFSGCSSLSWVSSSLFESNPKVLTFSSAFMDCSSLTVAPEGLFSANTRVQDFSYVFMRCYSLAYVPETLFLYNTYARSFSYSFYNCSAESLSLSLYIGSDLVSYASQFATGASGDVTVYLQSGSSTSYSTFTSNGVTVEVPETWPV